MDLSVTFTAKVEYRDGTEQFVRGIKRVDEFGASYCLVPNTTISKVKGMFIPIAVVKSITLLESEPNK